MDEVKAFINKVNIGKAAGKDGIFPQNQSSGEHFADMYRIISNNWNAGIILK